MQWVATPASKGSSWPRDQTPVSYIFCIGRQVLYHSCHPGSCCLCLIIAPWKVSFFFFSFLLLNLTNYSLIFCSCTMMCLGVHSIPPLWVWSVLEFLDWWLEKFSATIYLSISSTRILFWNCAYPLDFLSIFYTSDLSYFCHSPFISSWFFRDIFILLLSSC